MSDDRVSYLHQRDPSVDRRYRIRPTKKLILLDRVTELEADIDENNENCATANSLESAGSETIEFGGSVFLRLRPTQKLCKHYHAQDNVIKVHNIENSNTNNKDMTEKHYEFSSIFDNKTTQKDIYDKCVHSYIENEENLTVLTYGTSGSGKTFTMHGNRTNAGLIPRALDHIFTRYRYAICGQPAIKYDKGNVLLLDESNMPLEEKIRAKFISDRSNDIIYAQLHENINAEHNFESIPSMGQTVMIWISFAEIYNENVFDLLNTGEPNSTKRKNLKIISNDGNAFIKDLTSVHVRTVSEAYAVMNAGLEQINFASTNINSNSSRSHCIFIVNIINYTPPNEYRLCTYKFCDLAGSERLKKTENIGNRLKEAQRINSSLLVLGRCLDMLYQSQQSKSKEIVPFRESKLTLLLQKSLMGREKITTIVNMLPNIEFFEENLHVLNFSSIAQKIVYKEIKPKAAPNKRAARSSLFPWFIQATSSPNNCGNNSDLDGLYAENDRLEIENIKLQEEIDKQYQEHAKKEQQIRKTLVEEFEKREKATNDYWERRLNWLEKNNEETVKRLEDEIINLKKQLNSKNMVIEIDDEDFDSDDSYNNDDSKLNNRSKYHDDEVEVVADEPQAKKRSLA